MSTIGDNLKRIRTDKQLSTRKLAELSGISNGYISQLEKGIDTRTQKPINPTFDVLQKLASGLKVEVHELTGVEASMISNNTSPQKKPKDLLRLLEQEDYTLNGRIATQEDKDRLAAIIEAMYWDAKEKNKRKKT